MHRTARTHLYSRPRNLYETWGDSINVLDFLNGGLIHLTYTQYGAGIHVISLRKAEDAAVQALPAQEA